MPNTKDTKKSSSQGSVGSKGSMSGSGSDFERQGQGSHQGGKSGHGSQGKQTTGSPSNIEDDDMTAGGREGQFSDKNRDREGQWSPGSNQSSDQ